MLHGPPDEARTRRPGTLGNTPCQSDRVTHNSLSSLVTVSLTVYIHQSCVSACIVSSRAREDEFPGPVSRARDIQKHAPYLRQRHLNGRGGRLDGPLSCASMPSPPVPRAAWCASARHPRDVVPHALVPAAARAVRSEVVPRARAGGGAHCRSVIPPSMKGGSSKALVEMGAS